MVEVKWIKIVTDIFDDEKILLIESLPESDSIIVIWFKLLCLAGKNNNKGIFTLNERIPYTDEMLSTIFRRQINTVRMALKTFEQYGMIEIIDGVITIPNWEKHQNEAKLEVIRNYNRIAKQREREKKQHLLEKCQGHVIDCHETDTDTDIDIDSSSGSKEESEGNVFKFFNQNIGPITGFQSEMIGNWLDEGFEPSMLTRCIADSLGASNKWSYLKAKVDACGAKNVKTLEQYLADKVNSKSKKESKAKSSNGNVFLDMLQKDGKT